MSLDPNIQEFITRLSKDQNFQNHVQEYTEDHLSIRRKRINDWNENNRDKLKASQKEYAKTESGKIAAKRRLFKRKTLEKEAFEALSPHEKKKVKKFYEECPDGFHVDHIIPLVKGGEHKISNLQYLLPLENAKKSYKTAEKIDKIEIEYPSELLLYKRAKKTTENPAVGEKRTREQIRDENFSKWKGNLKNQPVSKLDNLSKETHKPSSLKEILAAVYRDRHKHPITLAYIMRKFHISYDQAVKIKARVDAYDAKNPVWYPGKPAAAPKEDLDAFLKRITPKRN